MKIDLLETPSEDVRIEIIPLIDVIFCILTFFILAAVGLTRQQAIDLDLPNASTGSPLAAQGTSADAAQRQRLYVSIDAIGQVYVDQQPVTLDLLTDILRQHRQRSPAGLIVLYAARDARYEDVIRVLDLLRSIGGDRVALATLPGESPLEASPTEQSLPQPEEPLESSPLPSTTDPFPTIPETPGQDNGTFETPPSGPTDPEESPPVGTP